MGDVVYSDGFPKGWDMVHRSDTTLLCFKDRASFGSGSQAVCAAPRLVQGKEWLATAQQIAWAMSDDIKEEWKLRAATCCDHCGLGVRTDLHGDDIDNSRSRKTWDCDDCGQRNFRNCDRYEQAKIGVIDAVIASSDVSAAYGGGTTITMKFGHNQNAGVRHFHDLRILHKANLKETSE
jgi:hypothetical protein